MTVAPDDEAVARFRAAIARRLGLRFDDDKSGFLAEILRRGAAANGVDTRRYLEELERGGAKEWRAPARELTVTETYFFRNAAQFAAMREAVTADRRATPVNILSAACASGEEPYSIAILLDDLRAHGCAPSIQAFDINGAMLAKAASGRYSGWSLRETTADRRARHFVADGNEFLLDPAIRDAVAFTERNLADEDPAFWLPGAFDIVFCRNVLMYFTTAMARAVIARIARSLTPGGLLFLGHAETLRGLSRDFSLCHTHGTFYHQRNATLAPPDAAEEFADPVWESLPRAADGAATNGAAWYEVIENAAARVRGIAARSGDGAESAAPPGTSTAQPIPTIAHAMALLADEQYAEALGLLNALPADSAQELETLFLRGVVLMHRGDLAGAEQICDAVLLRDRGSAGAHYLMALCREAGGDCRGAVSHDRQAAALDPDFAMPRLHLGLLARRTGDRALARRELARALALLPGEESTRLRLFGGGFGRDALRALCQAELTSAEGAP